MTERYFSDRESGPVPRVLETLPDGAWRGLCSLTMQVRQQQRLAHDFPQHCDDPDKAAAVVATDWATLTDAWVGAVPGVELPLRGDTPQPLAMMLDSLEFLYDHVHDHVARDHHSFYKHEHLRFLPSGRRSARQQLVSEVNAVLARNGVAIEFTQQGQFRRIGPEVLVAALSAAPERRTDDDEINRLLTEAKRKFLSPDPQRRRDALHALWDAWERLKTLLDGDKRRGIKALIEAAATAQMIRDRLDKEAGELTNVGNKHSIRHSETTQVALETQAQADYFFTRLWALIELLVPQRPGR